MEQLYWITVLGSLSNALIVTAVILGLVLIAYAIIYLMWRNVDYELDLKYEYGRADELKQKDKRYRSWIMKLGVTIIATIFLSVFIPSTKQLCFIYGVGSTIDYLKSNDTAKQLPDKAIQALDKYLESLNEDKEEEQ